MRSPLFPEDSTVRPNAEFRTTTSSHLGLFLLIAASFCAPFVQAVEPRVGDDVVAALARAARGEPLRYVAIGGSITQESGSGWIGDWLSTQFPESAVSVVNSGMSATGSVLGIFRIERDILAYQPDLVAIEFCVNDDGQPDEQVIRCMETLVVRLKSLPDPPAIIILESATRHGVKLERHRRVARHYGLLEVDWQAALDEHLHPGKLPLPVGMDRGDGADWEILFRDNVHPNGEGQAFYARVMKDTLRPLVEEARRLAERPGSVFVRTAAPLPPPLSEKPLLLDARLVPLQGLSAPGWRSEQPSSTWWTRFFQGVLAADKPGMSLRIPVRGTAFGLLYVMDKRFGTFHAAVDGGESRHVQANTRDGYSSVILGMDLPAREHILTISLPAGSETDPDLNGPVKLGYLLVAGGNDPEKFPK